MSSEQKQAEVLRIGKAFSYDGLTYSVNGYIGGQSMKSMEHADQHRSITTMKIVEAVNNHEKLVEALKETLEDLDATRDRCSCVRNEWATEPCEECQQSKAVLVNARAVLASLERKEG